MLYCSDATKEQAGVPDLVPNLETMNHLNNSLDRHSTQPKMETFVTAPNTTWPAGNQGLLVPNVPATFIPNSDRHLNRWQFYCNESICENIYVYGDKTLAMPGYNYTVQITAVICLVTMMFFAVMLSKKLRVGSSMSRSTYFLLLSIVVSDSLILILAIAKAVYLYSYTGGVDIILPFHACGTMLVLERLSVIPRAASTWFTVLLIIQRYKCIAMPFVVGKYMNTNKSVISVVVVTVLTTGLHFCRFFDTQFVKMKTKSHADPYILVETCQSRYRSWVWDAKLYESVFLWLRIVVIKLIPCIIISIFVILLLNALKNISLTTKHLCMTATKRQVKRRQLSIFVIVTATIVFCVEISNAIFLSIDAWESSTSIVIFSYETLQNASLGCDFVLYLSYLVIFLIYCIMFQNIRQTTTSCWSMINRRSKKIPDGMGS